jgi:hypothetical protein
VIFLEILQDFKVKKVRFTATAQRAVDRMNKMHAAQNPPVPGRTQLKIKRHYFNFSRPDEYPFPLVTPPPFALAEKYYHEWAA